MFQRIFSFFFRSTVFITSSSQEYYELNINVTFIWLATANYAANAKGLSFLPERELGQTQRGLVSTNQTFNCLWNSLIIRLLSVIVQWKEKEITEWTSKQPLENDTEILFFINWIYEDMILPTHSFQIIP